MVWLSITGLFLVLKLIHITEGVGIWIVYGESLVFSQEFSILQTVLSLKQQISFQVGLCPEFIQIIDIYRNTQQDEDGFGEFLDRKTLKDYCITEESKGIILYAERRVVINDLVVPTKTFATVSYLDNSAMKLPLRGSQRVWQFRQAMATYLSIKNVSTLIVGDWYDNDATDNDGGWPLDDKPLSRYGWGGINTGVILFAAIEVPNYLQGTATIYYGAAYTQKNVPFRETQTVLQFKTYLSSLTGISVLEMTIFDYSLNDAQTADDGIWQNQKKLSEYNMRNGERAALGIVTRVAGRSVY